MDSNYLLSESPIVTLEGVIDQPYNLGIAAARTCYSSKGIVTVSQVAEDEPARELRDRIALSTLKAGHLTTRQHASFVFGLDKVSRQFIWSFLHSHPYYNSEQVSQRYVKVAPGHFTIPPLKPAQVKHYLAVIELQMQAYNRLIDLLLPEVERRFYQIFPQRRRQPARYLPSLKKRAYEIARYVLPVATHAYLYHTVSALTLLRYWRLCQAFDVPCEQRLVVQAMIDLAKTHDPDFTKELIDPLPLEATPEYAFFQQESGTKGKASAFVREFDDSLEGHVSRLVDYKVNAEPVMAQAVRSVLGVDRETLSDDAALECVLNPGKNPYFGDTLNVTTLAKLTRTLYHPHYTFRKKISHTADSQDQRHRMVPGSRPILARHYSGATDYILPLLVQEYAPAREVYEETMERTFAGINGLLDQGVSHEFALYLLPNAFPIRFEESGDLLNLHHKWKSRACYTAQEEIFFATLDELKQVQAIHPRLARHILAPCYLRKLAGETPYCPEGDRYCGVPVWKFGLEEYARTL